MPPPKEQQNRTIRSILDKDILYKEDNKTDDTTTTTTDYTYYDDDVDNTTDTDTGHPLDLSPRSAHQFMQPKSLVSFDNVYFEL